MERATLKELREAVVAYLLARDGEFCGICGKVLIEDSDTQLDHILPVNMGGQHRLGNMQLTHRACNGRKPRGGQQKTTRRVKKAWARALAEGRA